MKKKLIAMMAVMTLGVSLFSGPMVAKADTTSGNATTQEVSQGGTATFDGVASKSEALKQEVYQSSKTTDKTSDEDGQNSIGLAKGKTYVVITGTEKKICYSVEVTFGNMTFKYDYGMHWDPSQHKYIGGDTSKAGWVTKNIIDGANNRIHVENKSNYPVSVTCTYSDDTTAKVFGNSSDVHGVFSDDNEEIKKAISNNDISSPNSDASWSFCLDIDDSLVQSQSGAVYGKSEHNLGVTNEDVYFGYYGTPSSGSITGDEPTLAGEIKVKIVPENISESSVITVP